MRETPNQPLRRPGFALCRARPSQLRACAGPARHASSAAGELKRWREKQAHAAKSL